MPVCSCISLPPFPKEDDKGMNNSYVWTFSLSSERIAGKEAKHFGKEKKKMAQKDLARSLHGAISVSNLWVPLFADNMPFHPFYPKVYSTEHLLPA